MSQTRALPRQADSVYRYAANLAVKHDASAPHSALLETCHRRPTTPLNGKQAVR
jgi:hypothetical protein